jgi:hypothetical protein
VTDDLTVFFGDKRDYVLRTKPQLFDDIRFGGGIKSCPLIGSILGTSITCYVSNKHRSISYRSRHGGVVTLKIAEILHHDPDAMHIPRGGQLNSWENPRKARD